MLLLTATMMLVCTPGDVVCCTAAVVAYRVKSGIIQTRLSQLQELAQSPSAAWRDAAATVRHILHQRSKQTFLVKGLVDELERTRQDAYNLGLGCMHLIAEAGK